MNYWVGGEREMRELGEREKERGEIREGDCEKDERAWLVKDRAFSYVTVCV